MIIFVNESRLAHAEPPEQRIFENFITMSKLMKTFLPAVAALIASAPFTPDAMAIDILNPAVHCSEDTAKITSAIKDIAAAENAPGRYDAAIRIFEGCAEDRTFETDTLWRLRINAETFTPLSFINTVKALVTAAGTPDADWRDFAAEYEKVACRKGEDEGFPSVMWHAADWISDNIYRGNLKEMTENYSGGIFKTRSLDHLSRNRDKFAPLSNDEIFGKVEMTEMGFKVHRIPYLKRQYISRNDVDSDLKTGDIIIMLSNDDSKDIYRIGYVVERDGKKYLAGIDPHSNRVVIDSEPLERIFKTEAKHFFGFRMLRWQ